jgi:YidC/Oxa1 family membrane protein insertase
MEERRLLLAVALSLLVLTAYQMFFAPPPAPPPTSRAGASASSSSPSPGAATASPGSPVAPGASSSPPPIPSVPQVADDRERRVEVQGDDATLAFTNRGARLVSWRLERYHDAQGRPEEMVQTLPGAPRPLDVETGDPALDERLRGALFLPSSETLSLHGGQQGELVFKYADGDVEATKTLRVRARGYTAEVAVSVRRGGREVPKKITWGPGVGNPTVAETEVQGYQAPQAVALTENGVERHPAKTGPAVTLSPVRWAGVEGHYFAAVLVPPGGQGAAELRTVSLPAGEDGKPRLAPLVALDLGTAAEAALLYVGPKDHHTLAAAGHELRQVVPLGEWIGPIVLALMNLLRWVHGHVGNYGWSIVVLTVLINLVMAPLRHYSIANGVKMAKLAPEMRVIQDRYRKVPALDPRRQEMQKEVAALYARHGMSMGTQMMVGCLPLLLTMPFLIAFYRVLQVSIELRGADFLWIPDLSQKDPLYLTPLLMGASMFVMQRMTPTSMDPAQARMMMLMPVVLMAMFFAAPAGLNLYWLASNLCSIVQQGITLRIVRGAGEAGARKERRR